MKISTEINSAAKLIGEEKAVELVAKATNYRGYLTLEADTYLKTFTPENAFEGIRNLAAAAKRLAEMFSSTNPYSNPLPRR